MADLTDTNRPSISLSMTSQFEATSNEDPKAVEDLRNQLRRLQSENTTLRRSIPQLKDLDGNDLRAEFLQMAQKLSEAQQHCETWENMYAQMEQQQSKFKHKVSSEFQQLDATILEMKERAKRLENENLKLKDQIEDDKSKYHRLQNEKEYDTTFGDPILDIDNSTMDAGSGIGALATLATNNSYCDAEYQFSNLISLMEELKQNELDSQAMQQQILKFLKEHNINSEAVANNFEALSDTFREAYNKNRKQILQNNAEFANFLLAGGNNTQLQRHLAILNQDSMDSSIAQPLNQLSFMKMLNVCQQLFEKLRGTAKFLSEILNKIEESKDEDSEMVKFISELRLELDKSIQETKFVSDEIEKAEKTVNDLFGEVNLDETSDYHNDSTEGAKPTSDANILEAQNEISQLKEIIESTNALYSKTKISLDKLSDEYTSLEQEMNKKDLIVNEEKRKNEENLQKIRELRQSHLELDERNEQLEIECKELTKQLNETEKQLSENNKILMATRDLVEETKSKLKSTTEDYVSLLAIRTQKEDEVILKINEIRNLKEQVQYLNQENSKFLRKNDDLIQENTALSKKMEDLKKKCQNFERDLKKAKEENELLNDKTKGQSLDVSNAQTSGEIDDEQITHFTSFLDDCQNRVNELVQLLKKADVQIKENNGAAINEIPYFKTMLKDSRIVRLMLFKLCKYFENQKENMNETTARMLTSGIKNELRDIYKTLKLAASTTRK